MEIRSVGKLSNNVVYFSSKINYSLWIFVSQYQLQAVLTSIVLKQNVTMLDIVSTRMLGQFGFLAKVRH